jgi:acetyltransferase-like isoleucine patch superfamily enzyme
LSDKKLILVGSRANLADILYTARDVGYEVIGILDKHYYGTVEKMGDIPVIGSEEELLDPNCQWRQFDFFLANFWDGSQDMSGKGQDGGALRQQRIAILESSGVNVVNLIHPLAVFFHALDTITIGKGNLILGHARFLSHITIGNYSVIDWDCNIGTNSYIGNNVIVGAASTTGHVQIGDNSRIGVGCILIPRKKKLLSIGENSIVHIGTTVTKDVPPNSVYTIYNKIQKRINIKG